MNKKEAIEFIKTRWPKFLEEQGLTNDQYKETCKLERFKKNEIKFENISKAKTPQPLVSGWFVNGTGQQNAPTQFHFC
jgi:hypothetical protein